MLEHELMMANAGIPAALPEDAANRLASIITITIFGYNI